MHLDSYRVVVDKSTVPVKTGERVASTIRRYAKPGVEFDVISNPEFLREAIRLSLEKMNANVSKVVAVFRRIERGNVVVTVKTDNVVHAHRVVRPTLTQFRAHIARCSRWNHASS